MHRRAIGAARFVVHFLTPTPRSRARAIAQVPAVAPARPRNVARRRLYRRHLVLRLTSDRTLPIAIALIVLMAAGVSLAPAATPVGAAQANATGVRLAIGGGAAGLAALDGPIVDENTDVEAGDNAGYVDDGTLYKPVAVDTSIQSSANMLRHYTVKDGDSLTGIASRFGVSMMTLWWANKITSKDSLHVGQDLIIPPVTGLVVTVKAGDTLDSLAAANKIDAQQIIDVNGLEDTNLIVGQVLVLPGAKGEPIATPTPTKKPVTRSTGSGGGGAGVGPSYSGGAWAWPVIGGNNYISQYFHSYHLGIDVAAAYGSTIVAVSPGTVVFAGWKSGGGGYQVFIYHGSGLYTAYLHMSRVAVTEGQVVAKGQRIGYVGASGNATGPHCHFAVSVGWPWRSGSYFVNPLRYY